MHPLVQVCLHLYVSSSFHKAGACTVIHYTYPQCVLTRTKAYTENENYVFTKPPSSSHTIHLSLSGHGGDVTGPCKQAQRGERKWREEKKPRDFAEASMCAPTLTKTHTHTYALQSEKYSCCFEFLGSIDSSENLYFPLWSHLQQM